MDGGGASREDRDDSELSAALTAASCRKDGGVGRGLGQQPELFAVTERDEPADRFDRERGVRAQEPVVPHLLHALGQHVLEESPDELHRIEGHSPPAVGSAPAVGEGDRVVVAGDDAVITDADSEHVGRQILQRHAAVPHGLGVDDPGSFPDGWIDFLEEPGLAEFVAELRPEQDRQGLHGQEERRSGRDPGVAIGADGSAGHDVVDVGVVVEGAIPGVQHAEEPWLAVTEKPPVCGEDLDGLARRVEDRGVDGALVPPRQAPQLGGQREREQKIRAGQQAESLSLEPRPGLLLLAGRAVPIAAGSSHDMVAAAGGASVVHRAKGPGPAGTDGAEHLAMLRRHPRAESFEILPAMPPQHLGDGRHGGAATS